MQFEFQKEYNSKSNTELLLIVRQPSEYQPEAIAAARAILDLRDVSNQEFDLVDEVLRRKEKATRTASERRETFHQKSREFFEPLLNPTEKIEASKCWGIFLVALVLQHAYWIWHTIRAIIAFLECTVCRMDVFTVLQFSMLLFFPTNLFLIFRQKPAGWKIFFAGNIFLITITIAVFLFDLIRMRFPLEPVPGFWELLSAIAFAWFLWRTDTAALFSISSKSKWRTLRVSVVTAVLMVLAHAFIP